MKKILIFSLNYYPRFIGGAEIAIKEITDRVDADSAEFHMITLRFDKNLSREEKIGGVIVHRIGFARKSPTIADLQKAPLRWIKYWYQFGATIEAVRLHKIHHFDTVWAMMAHSCGVPAALFKMIYPRVRYVLTLQEGDPPEHIERLALPVWPLFKYAFTSADILQTISTFLESWGRRMGFSGVSKVVPNGVDIKHFAREYSESEISDMRAKIGKKKNDVFLVTTSRLVRKNAIDDVIRALAYMPDNTHFVIYGSGPDEIALRILAHELDIEHRVRFMGYINHEDMPLMLKACDIFIRPSRSEGMGISFIEAFASSIPVVATQVGGISDLLFDCERNPDHTPTGFAVNVDDPQDIARAVKYILDNQSFVKHVVENAHQFALERHDWDLVATEMRKVLDI